MFKACHNLKEKEKNMSEKTMINKVEELRELELFIDELKEEAEAIRDSIKQEMLVQDTEELEVGQYIIRWTSVLSQRFDSTAFKKVMPEIYKAYVKQVSSKRFSIS